MKAVQDYEPGGSLLPGRNYSSSSYDYGFNGMRKDDEIHGATGTSYDFGARLYDPRVGRWLSLDMKSSKYPANSPYGFVANNPILNVEVDGNVFVTYIKVKNAETGKTETQKVTFDGVRTTMQRFVKGATVGEAVEYTSGTSAFVDDMVESYKYIVDNGADVDGAMKAMATMPQEVEVIESTRLDQANVMYDDGTITINFRALTTISEDDQFGNQGAGKAVGNQSGALGFWSEVYHGYLDLIDTETRDRLEAAGNTPPGQASDEEYIHVDKEHKVIDALKTADPGNKETKRSSYGSARPAMKRSSSATSTDPAN